MLQCIYVKMDSKVTDVTQSSALCVTEQGSKKLKPCSVAHRTLHCVT